MGKGRRPERTRARRAGVWTGAAATALFATVLSAWISRNVLEGIPHVTDGVSYAFQARIFATGRLWLTPPPIREAFEVGNIILTEDRWASAHTPGWPLLLSLGYLLGAPWLATPVLLGLSVLGVFVLGRVLYDDLTGLLGGVLLAVSPFALVFGATYLSHVPTLCVLTWTLAALAEGRKSGRAVPLLLAGFLAGFSPAVRPYTAAAFLLPAGVWLIWRTSARVAVRRMALVVAGAALPLLLFAAFNTASWGHPFRTGYSVAFPSLRLSGSWEMFRLSFLPDHLPRYLLDLNRVLWAEPWPDLLPLLFLLPRKNRREGDGLLAACPFFLVLAYSVFHSYDQLHAGPRYALEGVGALALLVSRGLVTGTAAVCGWLEARRVPRAAQTALSLGLAALLVGSPLARRLPALLEINAKVYCGQTHQPLFRDGGEKVGENALILVSGNLPMISYSGLALLNEPDPQAGGRVFALDYRLRREELMEAYPRKQVWKLAIFLDSVRPENALLTPAYEIRRVLWTRVR